MYINNTIDIEIEIEIEIVLRIDYFFQKFWFLSEVNWSSICSFFVVVVVKNHVTLGIYTSSSKRFLDFESFPIFVTPFLLEIALHERESHIFQFFECSFSFFFSFSHFHTAHPTHHHEWYRTFPTAVVWSTYFSVQRKKYLCKFCVCCFLFIGCEMWNFEAKAITIKHTNISQTPPSLCVLFRPLPFFVCFVISLTQP